jgi:SPP1 family predicted phage head-tail adaptor
MFSAGSLRHRVNIESLQETQDAVTGERIETWTTLYSSIPASVEPLSVKEYLASQQMQSEVSVRITIRFVAGLRPTMRIRHGSVVYNMAGVLPDLDSGREYLTIPCIEVPSESTY